MFFCRRTPESKTCHEKRVVPFTPEEVYSVVADVAKYKEFLPYCVNRSEEFISFLLLSSCFYCRVASFAAALSHHCGCIPAVVWIQLGEVLSWVLHSCSVLLPTA